MKKPPDKDVAYQTGLFRYGVIADLLAKPCPRGELAEALRAIAAKQHVQPWNGENATATTRTLERWLACARGADRPAEALQPQLRSDRGTTRVVEPKHREFLAEYRRAEPSWSVQLLFDNLASQFDDDDEGDGPSYSSVLRYMRAAGLLVDAPGRRRKHPRREVRSFEVGFVGELWHMDFHKGSRHVVNEKGEWVQPLCVAFIDDHSRLSRLPNKLRTTALLPLESRIRVRHHLDKRPQEELVHILSELLVAAGAEALLTPGLIKTMAEHAMGNVRAMMMIGNELLAAGAQRQARQLDEDLFFEVFKESIKKKRVGR